MRRHRRVAGAVVGALLAGLAPVVAFAPAASALTTTVVVDPASFGSTYAFVVEGPGGSGSMVSPVVPAPPLGTGAARLTTTGSPGGILFAGAVHVGTPFSDIDALTFDSYQPAVNAAANHSPSFQLGIDKDLTDASVGFQGRLVGVPISPTTGAWATWDGLSATDVQWGYTASAGAPSCQLSGGLCDWATAIAVFPNGGIHATPGFGFVGVKAGSGTSGLNETYVDALTVGINGDTTIYDLEADCSTTCYVNDATGNDANNGTTPTTAKKTVQAAVNQVNPLGSVIVAAGTYVEQVVITKELSLTGAGTGVTIIDMPAAPVTNTCMGVAAYAVVAIGGAGCATPAPGSQVSLSDLTISGTITAASCADRLYGLSIADEVTVTATDVEVLDIRATNPSLYGCQTGLAVLVGRQASGESATLEALRLTVTGFQKGGVVVDGPGSVANLTDSLIDGGLVPAVNNSVAMNGVQYARGAVGTIENSTIRGNQCRIALPTCSGYDATWAAGVLVYDTDALPGQVLIRNSDITDNDAGVLVDASSTNSFAQPPSTVITDNQIHDNIYVGVFASDSDVTVADNGIDDNGVVGVEIADYTTASGSQGATIERNTITGHDVGIDITDYVGPTSDVQTVNANYNDVSANSIAGIRRSAAPSVVDGTCNWWGAATGPNTAGASDKVGTFDTSPFLLSGNLATATCDAVFVSVGDVSVTEGNAGTTTASLPLTLSAPVGAPVTVNLSYADITAVGGVDYDDTLPLSVTIPANTTNHTAALTVFGDLVVEGSERFDVTISEPISGFGAPISIERSTGSVTITNDDIATVEVGDVTVTEGDAGATIATFDVSTTADLGDVELTGTVVLSDGTAQLARDDYLADTLTFTLTSGGPTTVSARVKGDVRFESDEDFTASIASLASNLPDPIRQIAVVGGSGTGTITNDDPAPVLTVGSQTIVEDDTGTQLMSFPVSITNPADEPITISYATTADSATAGSDFTNSTGSITFAPGDVVELITVPVLSDIVPESTERFSLTLSGAPGWVTVANAVARGFILDDDTSAVLTIGDLETLELNGGPTLHLVPVQLSSPVKSATSITISTVDGSAIAGSDYTAATISDIIPAGATTVAISIPILGDTTLEADENYFVTVSLTSPNPAVTIGDGTAEFTILNDDSVSLSVSGNTVTEGNAGTTPTSATVAISAAADIPVEVSWSVLGLTASASDYSVVGSAPSGTAVINPGDLSFTVDLEAIGDIIDEANETIRVSASSSAPGVNGSPNATVTINDDDAAPVVSIASATTVEGDAGSRQVALSLTLDRPSQSVVSVTAATAAGTASAGTDFTASSTTVTFQPHQMTAITLVEVLGDTAKESNEQFNVNLSSPAAATIGTGSAPVAIIDDDGDVAVTIEDSSVLEDSGPATFSVDLTGPFGQAITVGYTVSAGSASIPGDLPAASGSIVIPAGITTASISVPVSPDTVLERDEAFTVTLSLPGAPAKVSLADRTAIGSVINDDSAVVSVSGPASLTENNTTASYTVSLDAAAAIAVKVSYSTQEGTATAPEDYAARNGVVTFSPGQLAKTVTVPVKEDTIHESSETFELSIAVVTDLSGLSTGTDSVTTTITDDDPSPTINIAGATVTEGTGTTKVLAFPVTLTNPTADTVTATVVLVDGTATTPSDYSPLTTTITFLPGERSKLARVSIVADADSEANETFTAQLTAVVGATVGNDDAIGTILNDDSGTPNPGNLTVTINDASVVEGNTGTKKMTFRVSLNRAATSTVTVKYNTADGAAVAGFDYLAKTGTLTFTAGQRTKTITITIKGDRTREPNENLSVALSDPSSGLSLATKNTGTGSIVNDD